MKWKDPNLAPDSYAAKTWGVEGSKYHLLYLKLKELFHSKGCKLSVERMEAAVYFLEHYHALIGEGHLLIPVPACGLDAMRKRIKRIYEALGLSGYPDLNNLLQDLLKPE
jgi:hypothetical protein